MFDIVDNQAHFVLINKHAGVSVHKDEQERGLVEEVRLHLECKALYLVHRLDKMTSGLLLLAKTQSAASELSQAFANRQVEKFYLAISDKKPKKKQGLIKGDMAKSRRSMWKLLPSNENPAITQFFSASAEGYRLFLCKPRTGKTHQIRVALKSIGSPIVGDPIYATADTSADTATIDRGYLHAFALSFDFAGDTYRYQLDPTTDNRLGLLWQNESIKQQLAAWQQPHLLNWPKIK
ncbi:RNA pseudouridine synthase [Vibrio sp. UCD-FRSSP16_10]|uniref:TIGR01621 family pseudouridine synthase n=1 Tax=unclassified Vibrio TaxID=2614977 RepID=UPI0007FB9F82|nr:MULTISPECIES: TIGR01621 family pseudouridine synthase [unclassified Vibrio]OBT13862.1 RNA pseudouridine synthase [Vibrio sp. UCD-FRSSP16_30]OBT22743.1 RNA pseudouridine synthase [Vibrio sp. UCD-FRSSP16_10]